jgi:hypothetical protein
MVAASSVGRICCSIVNNVDSTAKLSDSWACESDKLAVQSVLLPIQRIVLTDDVSINLSVDVAVMHETSYIYSCLSTFKIIAT